MPELKKSWCTSPDAQIAKAPTNSMLNYAQLCARRPSETTCQKASQTASWPALSRKQNRNDHRVIGSSGCYWLRWRHVRSECMALVDWCIPSSRKYRGSRRRICWLCSQGKRNSLPKPPPTPSPQAEVTTFLDRRSTSSLHFPTCWYSRFVRCLGWTRFHGPHAVGPCARAHRHCYSC